MADQKLDFHLTFRTLTLFRPAFLAQENESALQNLVKVLLSHSSDPTLDHGAATKHWMTWLEGYASRIESERSEWEDDVDVQREMAGKAANPRFVLRQWVLEEVIAKLEKDPQKGKRVLAKVLHVGSFHM